MERAYGVEALSTNYALASVHVLFCYIIGIACMETVHANGNGIKKIVNSVFKAIFRNTLALGLILGFVFKINFGSILFNFIKLRIMFELNIY